MAKCCLQGSKPVIPRPLCPVEAAVSRCRWNISLPPLQALPHLPTQHPTLQQPAFCVLYPSSVTSASTSPYTALVPRCTMGRPLQGGTKGHVLRAVKRAACTQQQLAGATFHLCDPCSNMPMVP